MKHEMHSRRGVVVLNRYGGARCPHCEVDAVVVVSESVFKEHVRAAGFDPGPVPVIPGFARYVHPLLGPLCWWCHNCKNGGMLGETVIPQGFSEFCLPETLT